MAVFFLSLLAYVLDTIRTMDTNVAWVGKIHHGGYSSYRHQVFLLKDRRILSGMSPISQFPYGYFCRELSSGDHTYP